MRKCGDCQLCCTLLAITELSKPQNTKCIHQRHHKGCSIYAKRPYECEVWTCAWLSEYDAADMPRPDRCHYVIDTAWITVALDTAERGQVKVTAIPIWVDPKHPDAHKSDELRAWLLRRAAEHKFGLVNRSFLLIPPRMSQTGDWHEMTVKEPHQ